MYIGLHVKCPLFMSDLNENRIFSADFRKIITYQISWKSVQWTPSSLRRDDIRTDRRTDMTKLTVANRTHLKMGRRSDLELGICTPLVLYLFNTSWTGFLSRRLGFTDISVICNGHCGITARAISVVGTKTGFNFSFHPFDKIRMMKVTIMTSERKWDLDRCGCLILSIFTKFWLSWNESRDGYEGQETVLRCSVNISLSPWNRRSSV